MSKHDISPAATSHLVLEFVTICMKQKAALEEEDMTEYGRLLKRQMAIVDELKGRTGDQRRALVPLYEHDDIHVRLMSSRMTLAIEPTRARATLEAIRKATWEPQSFDAGMTLRMLDAGMFKPS